ncbi:eCIS core domain-containing protein [Chitinophaga filiformis]|uniref:eCIS core domain-containing protein n=1 Tax=Chitinophaga filiformis TaxID=104663 RepID=A0A1G7P5U0_CHIFI|nr:DUF4157 domain-containing protein [Chitinophaga filiformis]SDF80949.1 protein of unknown function [Chitinophaga filiformis]
MIKATDNKSTSSKAKQPAGNSFFGKEEGGSAFFGEKETAKEPFFVQRKLTIGKPDDHYEKQADQVADKVVQRTSEPAAVQAKAVAPAPVTTVPTGHTPSSAAQSDALQMKEQEGKEEEISEGEKKLQRKPIFDSMADPPDDIQKKGNGNDATDTAGSGLEDRLQKTKGSGTPLPSDTKTAMESSIGADFSNVRIHTGSEAAALSNDLQAQAFTHGNDIYFNDNKFDSTSSTGRHLLAHELTHTVQQGAAVQKKADPALMPEEAPAVQKKEDSPAASASAEKEEVTPDVQPKAIDTIQRAPGGKPAAGAAPAGVPGEVVNISSGRFNPSASLAEAIKGAGRKGLDININAGKVAGAGVIKVREKDGVMESLKNAYLPLNMPMFSAANPTLAVRLANGEISGFATIGQSNAPEAIPQWLRKNGKAIGWLTGIDVENVLSKSTNTFENGNFTFTLNGVKVKVGGFAEATMDLGFANMKPSAHVTADLDIHGVAKGNLDITLMDDKMSGEGAFGVSFKGFSGEIAAKFQEGVLDVKGMVAYSGDRLSGSLMLVMTDKKTADNFAVTQLGGAPAEEAAPPAEVPAAEGKGPRGMAGMGTLTFNMTEWFAGSVNVIVDGKGFVTVIGKIAPPKEIILFQQRDYSKELFKLEARAAYGIPVIGNVFVFANMALIAMAKVGPAKIYNIEVAGTYSNNPDVAKNISLSGSLNMSAYAGLRLRAEGGAGLELAGHDLKVGVGVNADAGVKGYVDARPTIGYRDPGEFFFKGHMEIAAQPFLGLSGDLFVELDSPWWSPLPDKKWTWPIGALEYPLPGEFGIGADMEYVLGSGKVPEVTFSEAKFDGGKFMTDLVDDHVPPKSGAGDKEKQGKFVDGGAAQAGPAAGAPPPAAAPGKPGAGAAPAGGAAGAGGGKGKDKEKDKGKVDPEAVKNFAAAMKKVKELEGHKPMTRTELMATLDGIKKQFNVTGISFAAQGTDIWMVTGTMQGMPNKQSVKVKAAMKPGDEKEEGGQNKETEKQLAEGVKALIAKDKETAAGDKQLTKPEAEKVAADVAKSHNKIFQSITVLDKKDHWNYLYIQRAKKTAEVPGSGIDATKLPPEFKVGAYFKFDGEIYRISEIKLDQDRVHMVDVKYLISNKKKKKIEGEKVFMISIALKKGSITEYKDPVPAVRKFPASWPSGVDSVRPWLYESIHKWDDKREEIQKHTTRGIDAVKAKVRAAKARAIATGKDTEWKQLSKHQPKNPSEGIMIINENTDYNTYDPDTVDYNVDHINDLGMLWTTIGRDASDSVRRDHVVGDNNLRVITGEHNRRKSGKRYEMSVGPNFTSERAEDNTPGAKTIKGKNGVEEPFL